MCTFLGRPYLKDYDNLGVYIGAPLFRETTIHKDPDVVTILLWWSQS